MKYRQRYTGEPFITDDVSVTQIRCCDCGLVHRIKRVRLKGRKVKTTVWTLYRATAASRRGKKYDHVKGVKWKR